MPGRTFNSSDYRYGFNGKEKDDEINGEGNSYDFGERNYDPRIARFLSMDDYASAFPSYSPYVYALNSPLFLVDQDGMYPKPSEIFAQFGLELPPLAAGIIDGAADSSPLGMIGFVYDLTTNSQFRSDMANVFAAISNDPIGVLGNVLSDYKDVIDRVMSGKATDEDLYIVGEEIGGAIAGLITGGAINKYSKKLAEIEAPNSKVAKKAGMPAWVKEGKEFEKNYFEKLKGTGKKVTTQVSFEAIDPVTGKKVRAVVDGIIDNADGTKDFIETKLRSTTGLTKNQEIVYKALENGEAVAVGKKAKEAGFKKGQKVKAKVKVETKY